MSVEVAVLLTVLAVLAYWRYTPTVPTGVSDRKKRITGLRMKAVMLDVGSVLEYLRVTTFIRIYRTFLKFKMSFTTETVPKSLLKVTETTFDGVKVVVFEPKSTQTQSDVPGLVYCHGGSFCFGSALEGKSCSISSHIALKRGIVVVSIDYRLAPEHIFPAGLNDCVTATKFFIRNAKRYNVDPSRIGIAGDSSGANFVAVVALKLAQQKHHPGLKLQVLLSPVTQLLTLTDSVYKYGPCSQSAWEIAYIASHYLFVNKSKINFILQNPYAKKLAGTHYLNFLDPSLVDRTLPPLPPGKPVRREDVAAGDDALKKALNPHVSPLLAEEIDVKSLPSALVTVSEFDTFRDHGICYAKRLERAGVKVKMIHYKDGFHGQVIHFEESERANEMMEDILDYLKENL